MQTIILELDQHTDYSVPLPGYQTLLNIIDNYLLNLYRKLCSLPKNWIWVAMSKMFIFSNLSLHHRMILPKELHYDDKKLDGLLILLEYCSKYHKIIHQKERLSPFLLGIENEEIKRELEELYQRIDLVPFFASLIPHVSWKHHPKTSIINVLIYNAIV
jgi:hypothetical protein